MVSVQLGRGNWDTGQVITDHDPSSAPIPDVNFDALVDNWRAILQRFANNTPAQSHFAQFQRFFEQQSERALILMCQTKSSSFSWQLHVLFSSLNSTSCGSHDVFHYILAIDPSIFLTLDYHVAGQWVSVETPPQTILLNHSNLFFAYINAQ